jgi:hypothetical protein
VFEYIDKFCNPRRKHRNDHMRSFVDVDIRQQKLKKAGVWEMRGHFTAWLCFVSRTQAHVVHAVRSPQIVRGVAIRFRLLPTARRALGALTPSRVRSLFNLMRNLGTPLASF